MARRCSTWCVSTAQRALLGPFQSLNAASLNAAGLRVPRHRPQEVHGPHRPRAGQPAAEDARSSAWANPQEIPLAFARDARPDLAPPSPQNFMYQLCIGMAHLHRHGVMHRSAPALPPPNRQLPTLTPKPPSPPPSLRSLRDLKPQNLLVDKATNTLKIADLGLGRAFSVPVKSYTHEARQLRNSRPATITPPASQPRRSYHNPPAAPAPRLLRLTPAAATLCSLFGADCHPLVPRP